MEDISATIVNLEDFLFAVREIKSKVNSMIKIEAMALQKYTKLAKFKSNKTIFNKINDGLESFFIVEVKKRNDLIKVLEVYKIKLQKVETDYKAFLSSKEFQQFGKALRYTYKITGMMLDLKEYDKNLKFLSETYFNKKDFDTKHADALNLLKKRSHLILQNHDDVIGIVEKYREKIESIFFRGDSTVLNLFKMFEKIEQQYRDNFKNSMNKVEECLNQKSHKYFCTKMIHSCTTFKNMKFLFLDDGVSDYSESFLTDYPENRNSDELSESFVIDETFKEDPSQEYLLFENEESNADQKKDLQKDDSHKNKNASSQEKDVFRFQSHLNRQSTTKTYINRSIKDTKTESNGENKDEIIEQNDLNSPSKSRIEESNKSSLFQMKGNDTQKEKQTRTVLKSSALDCTYKTSSDSEKGSSFKASLQDRESEHNLSLHSGVITSRDNNSIQDKSKNSLKSSEVVRSISSNRDVENLDDRKNGSLSSRSINNSSKSIVLQKESESSQYCGESSYTSADTSLERNDTRMFLNSTEKTYRDTNFTYSSPLSDKKDRSRSSNNPLSSLLRKSINRESETVIGQNQVDSISPQTHSSSEHQPSIKKTEYEQTDDTKNGKLCVKDKIFERNTKTSPKENIEQTLYNFILKETCTFEEFNDLITCSYTKNIILEIPRKNFEEFKKLCLENSLNINISNPYVSSIQTSDDHSIENNTINVSLDELCFKHNVFESSFDDFGDNFPLPVFSYNAKTDLDCPFKLEINRKPINSSTLLIEIKLRTSSNNNASNTTSSSVSAKLSYIQQAKAYETIKLMKSTPKDCFLTNDPVALTWTIPAFALLSDSSDTETTYEIKAIVSLVDPNEFKSFSKTTHACVLDLSTDDYCLVDDELEIQPEFSAFTKTRQTSVEYQPI